MDALGRAQPETRGQEIRLQEWFAAREGHAAARSGIIRLKTAQLFHQRLGRNLLAALGMPGVRVVAILAAQRAALQKHHRADTWAIHRAHGLDRV